MGDLRGLIVETIRSDKDAGASELEIARRSYASRDAVRRALDRLERYGHVEQVRRERGLAVVVVCGFLTGICDCGAIFGWIGFSATYDFAQTASRVAWKVSGCIIDTRIARLKIALCFSSPMSLYSMDNCSGGMSSIYAVSSDLICINDENSIMYAWGKCTRSPD